MERKIKLKSLNSHITCKICRGYLIDATTVTECLHTFCKSCVVKHLEDNNSCPTCRIVIHQSYPLQYISFDRTMQDIVYKLVPHLMQNEMKRERDFFKNRGLVCPKDVPAAGTQPDEKTAMEVHAEHDFHRQEEQVNLEMIYGPNMKGLPRQFIRCSSQATITHIKKYIANKVWTADKYAHIDILCNGELLGKDHTLKFVYVTRWRLKDPPMKLEYRRTIDF